MELVNIIRRTAEYMAGVAVRFNSHHELVVISDRTETHRDICLQGGDALDFLRAARKLRDKTEGVTLGECHLFLAREYVDCLWDRG